MKFKHLILKNFRNFKDVNIEVANKNLIFGMNDVGKSNLIHALRMLFDRRVRNQEVLHTDFHLCDVNNPIIIGCVIDLDQQDNDDASKIRASTAEAINTGNELYIQLKVIHDGREATPSMYWGSSFDNLIPVPTRGINKTALDDVFHCMYIPSGIEIDRTFADLKKELLNNTNNHKDSEQNLLGEIDSLTEQVNQKIKDLPSVQTIQNSINISLKNFDDQYEVEIASEQSVGGIHNHLALYTKNFGDTEAKLYPASGDGRRKKMMYAMNAHLLTHSRDATRKIPLLLIEEPENHLFLSAQIDLSRALFTKNTVSYVFLVSHSPQLFYHLSSDARLIRLYSESAYTTSKSSVAELADTYAAMRHKLLENLAQCFFVDRVLLVEGPSEKLLFDYLLDEKLKDNQNLRQRIYVMHVMGAHFLPYWKVLRDLGIRVLVKTDNDLKYNTNSTYSCLGLNRCVELLNICLPDEQQTHKLAACAGRYDDSTKHDLYNANLNNGFVTQLEKHNIFLSEIDLEHDLAAVLKKGPAWTDKLQKAKWHNMYEEITSGTFQQAVETIFNAPQFKCLSALIGDAP